MARSEDAWRDETKKEREARLAQARRYSLGDSAGDIDTELIWIKGQKQPRLVVTFKRLDD
jgi:hypothetical protein